MEITIVYVNPHEYETCQVLKNGELRQATILAWNVVQLFLSVVIYLLTSTKIRNEIEIAKVLKLSIFTRFKKWEENFHLS